MSSGHLNKKKKIELAEYKEWLIFSFFSCPILFSSLLKHSPLIKYYGVWSLHVVFIFTLGPERESGVRSHSEGDGVVTTMRDFSREAVCLMEPLAPVSFLPFQASLHGHIGSSSRSIPHCQHLLWGQFHLSCPFDTWLSMVVRADPSSSWFSEKRTPVLQ